MKKETNAYLDGGHVNGPGTATSDSIHAKLSNGEFVVKAKVVAQPGVLDFLKQLNNQDLVKKYVDGGLVNTAKDFAKFMITPGTQPQIGGQGQPMPVESSMVPSFNMDSGVQPTQQPEQVITPEPTPVKQQQTSPIAGGVNIQELKNRFNQIRAEQDPEKKAQLQQALSEHLKNANIDLSKIDVSQLQDNGYCGGGMVKGYAEGGTVDNYKDGGEAGDFNWNDHPVVGDTKAAAPEASTPHTSEFNWEDHALAENPPPMESRSIASEAKKLNDNPSKMEVSPGRAALVGAGQGATFGFGEELTSPVAAAAAMASGVPDMPNESTWDKYKRLMQEYRDTAREEQSAAHQQNPISYGAGALGGGLLTMKAPVGGLTEAAGTVAKGAAEAIPGASRVSEGIAALAKQYPRMAKAAGTLAKGAATGAGYGGLYGAGEAQGNLEERLPGAISGANTGAKIGATIPALGLGYQALKGIGSAASEIPVVADTLKNLKYGAQGENLITEKGMRTASDKLNNAGYDWYNDLDKLRTKIGKDIGSKIDAATKAGDQIDLTDDVNKALDQIKAIKESGSKEAATYASGVESEIRKLLDLKAPEAPEAMTAELPEGLSPKMANPTLEEETKQILVSPEKAQDLKQVLYEYTPGARNKTIQGLQPQEVEGAGIAKNLTNVSKEKLAEAVPELANKEYVNPEGQVQTSMGLNAEYQTANNIIKDLKIPESKSTNDIKDAIYKVLSQSENPNMSGNLLRRRVADVFDQIKQVSPEIADKYQNILPDLIEKNMLASRNIRGSATHGFIGTSRALATTAGNAVGLGLNKLGIPPIAQKVGSALSQAGDTANLIAKQANIPAARVAAGMENSNTVSKLAEPYQIQRKAASVAENADPQLLKDQAKQVRDKYGQQGEQLATILDNMSDKDKGGRRALMFTVLQNAAYRKMLGLIPGEE